MQNIYNIYTSEFLFFNVSPNFHHSIRISAQCVYWSRIFMKNFILVFLCILLLKKKLLKTELFGGKKVFDTRLKKKKRERTEMNFLYLILSLWVVPVLIVDNEILSNLSSLLCVFSTCWKSRLSLKYIPRCWIKKCYLNFEFM